MKNIICTLFLFIISQIGICQEEVESCFKLNNLSIEERKENYPFDRTEKILYVSFKENIEKLNRFVPNNLNPQTTSWNRGEIMTKYFKFLKNDYSKYNPEMFEEKIELSEIQKNELTDLIYNFGRKIDTKTMRGSGCYTPKNAILFFDKNNQLFQYFIICFDCEVISPSVTSFSFNNDCKEKLNLLKELFEKAGIEYGIKKQL